MSEEEFYEDVKECIGFCYKAGMSYKAIACEVKTNVSTIYRWYNKDARPSAYSYMLLKELCAKKGCR